MKKNGQYVGVDEKYIPEDEKYVDNSANSEIQDEIKKGVHAAKEYISNKDNQEKIKKSGKKGLKILKGIGIGYLAFLGFIFLMVIIMFIFVFSTFFKVSNQANNIIDKASDQINNVTNKSESTYSSSDISSFNSNIELYSGTEYGSNVSSLLDKVITNIKNNSDHSITVTYGETTTSNTTEITTLKKQFDQWTKYQVSLDYDNNGFINKVTITNY